MSNARVTVAIPHSHAYKWLQTSCYSLYQHDPGVECRYVVVDNYLAAEWTIQVLSASDIGQHFTILLNTTGNRWHGSALDVALRECDTEFFFGMESDTRILRDGWASWYLDQMAGNVACAGFYWQEDETRMYVNSSATMYRTEPLKAYDAACLANKDERCWYVDPVDGQRKAKSILDMHRDYWQWSSGAFADKRGWPVEMKLDKGRTAPGYYEPSQQAFYALAEDHDWVAVPTTHEYLRPGLAAGTWYGPNKDEEYTLHYWGGTSAHNMEKHIDIEGDYINRWVPWWLEREHEVWCRTVPAKLRQHASNIMWTNRSSVPDYCFERAEKLGVAWYYDYPWQPRGPYPEPPEA